MPPAAPASSPAHRPPIIGALWIPLLLGILAGSGFAFFPAAAVAAALLALLALIIAFGIATRRLWTLVSGRAKLALAAASLVTAALLVLVGNQMSTGREYAKAAKTAVVLADVYGGLSCYHDECGGFPASLHQLSRGHYIAHGQLTSCFDPAQGAPGPLGEPRVSIEYLPGVGAWRTDAELILAYDPYPLAPLDEGRLGPRLGWQVLFADGRIARLSHTDFDAALRCDRKRRTELGWPLASAPTGVAASSAGDAPTSIPSSQPAPLTVADLDRGVIGRLGVPLGTVVEVEAAIVGDTTRSKVGEVEYVLEVRSVEGVERRPRAVFAFRLAPGFYIKDPAPPPNAPPAWRRTPKEEKAILVRAAAGQPIKLLVYELGEFSGCPNPGAHEFLPWQDYAFGYNDFLRVVAVSTPPAPSAP